jgi:hypothetical protein
MTEPHIHKGQADFDFFIGSWHVIHRRLKERLTACSEWVEFTGKCVTQNMLGGFANVDDNILEIPTGTYRALTIRSYDEKLKIWSIWWLDGRNPGTLDTPVVGRFENGIGLFYAEDSLDGKPIRVRFQWSIPNAGIPRWEQAFSADEGRTWETNWIMDFYRLS